ncbi:ubiquitin carboxyl-terminal hydrolase 20 [Nilaparvata lugens]|uniref:ubiquitin carboxyl-terminal hydrolase 20 n=1 Tax=Nilaparvata lugens TaxID=108931 RepID=UPI00193DD6FB|nr:ubiquitin carboxyl-terminal hydrolase 20 [Nilaparvata lugens]
MAGQVASCPHMVLRNLQIDIDFDIIRRIEHCGVCNEVRQELWLCLFRNCSTKVCSTSDHRLAHQKDDDGERKNDKITNVSPTENENKQINTVENDHRLAHQQKHKKHSLFLSVGAKRVWCTICNGIVTLSDDSVHTHSDPGQSSRHRRNASAMDNTDNSDDDNMASTSSSEYKPNGLTGLQNLGNTCYMNAALQALSNTPPLTQFFLNCGPPVISALSNDSVGQRKPMALSKAYHRLMQELWDLKGRGYVAPSGVLYCVRNVYPMFRGCHQHDTQEFLRCFMDQLHEELKRVVVEPPPIPRPFECAIPEPEDEDMSDDDGQMNQGLGEPNEPRAPANEGEAGGASSQSEGDEYETCDSGVSERSSLSDETSVDTENNRSLSNSPSPLPGKFRNASSSIDSPKATSAQRKKAEVKYRSIISDVFDGKLLSSVQCLTCSRISTRIEAFQDLSLPIPSRDHLNMLHQKSVNYSNLATCKEMYQVDNGWLNLIWEWLCSWFWGPAVSLHDCLAAFFSADELKGDNMYRWIEDKQFSCFSECVSQVTTYDLISVICHHGTFGNGGHYTCFALNNKSENWYEFDDQCVTRVSHDVVKSCEAYVLFYRKRQLGVNQARNRAFSLAQTANEQEPAVEIAYAISNQWITRFNTFAEPGPIDNSDLLCPHGRILPARETDFHHLITSVPETVWEYLYGKYGGGPICTLDKLGLCDTCSNNNLLADGPPTSRTELEVREFSMLDEEEPQIRQGTHVNVICLKWFVEWNAYVTGKTEECPGPIDNTPLFNGQRRSTKRVSEKDYRRVSKGQWQFLHGLYGGGPEAILTTQNNQTVIVAVPKTLPSTPSNEMTENEFVLDKTSSGNWSADSELAEALQMVEFTLTQDTVPEEVKQALVDIHRPDEDTWVSSEPKPEPPSDAAPESQPKRVLRSSKKPVSTSLVDIRIDSNQQMANVETDRTEVTSPIHCSMPTMASPEGDDRDSSPSGC